MQRRLMRWAEAGFLVAILIMYLFVTPAAAESYTTDYTGPISGPFTLFPPGWDGPGLGAALDLTWSICGFTPDLPDATEVAIWTSAFATWAAATGGLGLGFTMVPAPLGCGGAPRGGTRNLEVGFYTDSVDHPILPPDPGFGPGVLAHCFFPGTFGPNPEPFAGPYFAAGDCHMNDAFTWRENAPAAPGTFSALGVAIHEIGHGLGLGHALAADCPPPPAFRPIMCPTFSPADVFTMLHADDIAGICALYLCPTPAPEPSALLLLGTGLLGIVGFNRKLRGYRRPNRPLLL